MDSVFKGPIDDIYLVFTAVQATFFGVAPGHALKKILYMKFKLRQQCIFLNDTDKNLSPLTAYGRISLESLQKVSRKYDPQRVFQDELPGGFKLYGYGKTAIVRLSIIQRKERV